MGCKFRCLLRLLADMVEMVKSDFACGDKLVTDVWTAQTPEPPPCRRLE